MTKILVFLHIQAALVQLQHTASEVQYNRGITADFVVSQQG
jgi:hypothetical protein